MILEVCTCSALEIHIELKMAKVHSPNSQNPEPRGCQTLHPEAGLRELIRLASFLLPRLTHMKAPYETRVLNKASFKRWCRHELFLIAVRLILQTLLHAVHSILN